MMDSYQTETRCSAQMPPGLSLAADAGAVLIVNRYSLVPPSILNSTPPFDTEPWQCMDSPIILHLNHDWFVMTHPKTASQVKCGVLLKYSKED